MPGGVITDTGFGTGASLRAVDFAGHVGAAVPVLSEAIDAIDVATTTAGGVVVVARRGQAGDRLLAPANG